MSRTPAFVVADPGSTPSGGHTYNARVAAAWRAAGREVEVVSLEGGWPRPDAAARGRLATALRARPWVLIDGLIGACCPQEIEDAVAAGRRVVLLIHLPLADEVGLSPAEAAALEASERRAAHAATAVVATSRTAAADVRRRHGLAHVAAAPPGADPAALAAGSGDGPPRLLMLAALTPRKNQVGFVAALTQVADRPWTAHLVGPRPDAEYAARVADAVEAAGLSDRITLTGPMAEDDLERCWDATDLQVLPSLRETYGLVVAEGLARGIPAIVSRGTGAAEALCGVPAEEAEALDPTALPGALVSADDPGDVAAALRRWLEGPQVRAAWRSRAEASRAALPPWAATAEQLWTLLDHREAA